MYCTKCGKQLQDNASFCTACGTFIDRNTTNDAPYEAPKEFIEDKPLTASNVNVQDEPWAPTHPAFTTAASLDIKPTPQEMPRQEMPRYEQPAKKAIITEADLPEKFSPLRPWTYFWINVLFAVPIVGFIFLLIFTFNDSNINRRNYARSFWCIYVIVAIIFAVMLTIALISGVSISRLLS